MSVIRPSCVGSLTCRVAGSMQKPLSDRAVEDQRLLGLIRAAYTASHGVYGAPHIFLNLREAGEICSKRGSSSLLTPKTL